MPLNLPESHMCASPSGSPWASPTMRTSIGLSLKMPFTCYRLLRSLEPSRSFLIDGGERTIQLYDRAVETFWRPWNLHLRETAVTGSRLLLLNY